MMKATVRRWSLTLLVALVASVLAACGGGNTSQGGEAGAGATTGGAAAPAPEATAAPAAEGAGAAAASGALPAECTETVALDYWNPFTGPDGPFMGTLTDNFNAANPNIQVVMTSQAEYYTQLGTAAASNSLPDVAIVHADQVATQAFRNVIRPIDSVVEQLGLSDADFPAPVWAAGEVAGQRYAIPLDIHPAVLYYNQDMLTEAGISAAPTNEEEFAAAAQALTANGNNGYLLTSGFFSGQIFQTLLHQFGGSEFNEEGTEATFNSEAGVRALQWMVDAQTNYGQPNLETDAEINAFKAGSAAMMMNGIWQVTNVTGEAVEFNGQGTAVPQFGDQPAVWAGSHQLTLPAQPDEDPCRDAAAAIFIQYLVDNSLEWSKAGQIPASNAVRESADFQALEPQASIAPSVENAFFVPSVPGITDALGPMGEAVTAVLSGTTTDIQGALDEAAGRSNQILADNVQNYGEAPAGASR